MAKWKIIIVSIISFSSTVFGEKPSTVFTRDCTVLSFQASDATVECQAKKGDPFKLNAQVMGGYVFVSTAECSGFVEIDCTGELEAKRIPIEEEIRLAKGGKQIESKDRGIGVGIYSNLGLMLGKMPSAVTNSSGSSYSFALAGFYSVTPKYRLMLGLGAGKLTLTRNVGNESVLSNISSVEFKQVINYYSVRLTGTYLFDPYYLDLKDGTPIEFGMELGGEILFPGTITQSGTLGGSQTLTNTGKPIFVLAGFVASYNVYEGLSVYTYLHGFIHVTPKNSARIIGGDIALGIQKMF